MAKKQLSLGNSLQFSDTWLFYKQLILTKTAWFDLLVLSLATPVHIFLRIYGLYSFIITQKAPIGKDKLSRPTQYCTIFFCHDRIFKNVLNINNDPLLKIASILGFFPQKSCQITICLRTVSKPPIDVSRYNSIDSKSKI